VNGAESTLFRVRPGVRVAVRRLARGVSTNVKTSRLEVDDPGGALRGRASRCIRRVVRGSRLRDEPVFRPCRIGHLEASAPYSVLG